ncbi:hypothetical protein GCM10009633_23700 [Janibacter melonis]
MATPKLCRRKREKPPNNTGGPENLGTAAQWFAAGVSLIKLAWDIYKSL